MKHGGQKMARECIVIAHRVRSSIAGIFEIVKEMTRMIQPTEGEFADIVKGHSGFNDPNYNWSIEDFDIGKKLGSGQYGKVFFVRERVTKVPFALKCMRKQRIIETGAQKQVLREIEIHSHLRHKNIITLYKFFHDKERIYMVLEMAFKGELYRHLRSYSDGVFPDNLAAKYIYQVCDALIYIHSKNVIHRDIKPENILMDSDGNIKLADFGWSVHAMSNRRATMCGTLDYLPPEIVRHQSYDPNVDLWCIGVLCYEFLAGRAPFENNNSEKTQRLIVKCDVVYPEWMNVEAQDLISKLLVVNPKSRLNLKAVQNHVWIQKSYVRSQEEPTNEVELDKLNTTMEEINRLEVQIEDANTQFRKLLTESTDHLRDMAKNISSSIEKSRPYFAAVEVAKKCRADCISAAADFRKSNEIYIAAKETENLAEKQFQNNQHEWKFDSAWQEMLNHAIIKVQNAESAKSKSSLEHQAKTQLMKRAELRLNEMEKSLRRHINRAHRYFDEKKRYDEMLNFQKERILMMEKLLHHIKESYANSLKNLERISEEIHEKRAMMARKDSVESVGTPPGPREPGVGAEVAPELAEEVQFSNTGEGCVNFPAEKQISPTYEELLKLKRKIRELATRPVEFSGHIDDGKLNWESELNETVNELDSMLLLREQKNASPPSEI